MCVGVGAMADAFGADGVPSNGRADSLSGRVTLRWHAAERSMPPSTRMRGLNTPLGWGESAPHHFRPKERFEEAQ